MAFKEAKEDHRHKQAGEPQKRPTKEACKRVNHKRDPQKSRLHELVAMIFLCLFECRLPSGKNHLDDSRLPESHSPLFLLFVQKDTQKSK